VDPGNSIEPFGAKEVAPQAIADARISPFGGMEVPAPAGSCGALGDGN